MLASYRYQYPPPRHHSENGTSTVEIAAFNETYDGPLREEMALRGSESSSSWFCVPFWPKDDDNAHQVR